MFYGVDNSSMMIKQAEAKSKNYINVHFCKLRVEELPFDNNFFDVIMSSNAFHHFSDRVKTLKEAYRVLTSNGKVYILDMTANNSFMRMIDRLSRKFEKARVKLYSTREFQALFEKAGFHYVASRPILSAIKVHIAEKTY